MLTLNFVDKIYQYYTKYYTKYYTNYYTKFMY